MLPTRLPSRYIAMAHIASNHSEVNCRNVCQENLRRNYETASYKSRENTQLELENSIPQPGGLLRTQMINSQEITRRTDHQVDNRMTDSQKIIKEDSKDKKAIF